MKSRIIHELVAGSSGALFNNGSICAVDKALIEKLKMEALESPVGRYRVCLHHSTNDPMQNMIVVHRRGNYSRPHCHPGAAMSFTMIEGCMDVLLFDDKGDVTDRIHLEASGKSDCGVVALRLAAGVVYMPVCLTETAVFHETLASPNPAGSATYYPSWCPSGEEPEQIAIFYRRAGIAG